MYCRIWKVLEENRIIEGVLLGSGEDFLGSFVLPGNFFIGLILFVLIDKVSIQIIVLDG